MEPLAVAALAVLVGSSDSVRPVASMAELAELFDLAHVSRAPARFDEAELAQLSARTLHALPYATVADRLAALGSGGEGFWLAVRGNLARIEEALDWWRIVNGPVTPVIDDESVVKAAAETLPAGPLEASVWKPWTDAVKAATGAKGKALFMPLRLALTGRDHGPELGPLLPFMGRERILARLSGRSA